MDYKPHSDSATAVTDLETQVALSAANGGDTGSKFKVSSGETRSEFQMPEAAPLIFSDTEEVTTDQPQNVFQKVGGFLGDYSDRRAQAVFVRDLPSSRATY